MRFVLKGLLRNIKSTPHNINNMENADASLLKNNYNQIIKSPPNQIVKYKPSQILRSDKDSMFKKNSITNFDLYEYFKLSPEQR